MTDINKPVVRYKRLPPGTVLHEGQGAVIEPIDHPSELVSNTKPVLTSRVVKLHFAGAFETMNTMYVPEDVV